MGAGTSEEQLQENLLEFASQASSSGYIVDAAMADDSARAANIWRIREGVSECLSKHGASSTMLPLFRSHA